MTTRLSPKEMNKILMPFADRHLSMAEKKAMRGKVSDHEQFAKDLENLIAEAQARMLAGDHSSPAALDMARRWSALIKPFRTYDPEALAKYQAVWSDALNDDAVAAKLVLNRRIFAFVDQALAHLNDREK